MNKVKPIIIIGMHRSGTSILSNILQKLGVCMGKDIIAHEESHEFQKMNTELFELFHASWDWPSALNEFKNLDASVKNRILQNLFKKISAKAFMKVYGVDVFNNYDSIFAKRYKIKRFGWKDPKNTYTLPIWLKLFPQAKVINIYRNGIDVASSLKIREQSRIKAGFKDNLLLSFRCLSLYGGFSLWTEYVKKTSRYYHLLSDDRFLSLSYESLIDNSYVELIKIANFLGVKKDKEYILELSNTLHKDRAYSFLRNKSLIEFYIKYGKKNNVMMDLGYKKIIDQKLEIRNRDSLFRISKKR
jgi:curved DNA-binding protein CbpA